MWLQNWGTLTVAPVEVKLHAYMYFFFFFFIFDYSLVAFVLQGGLRVSLFLRATPALPPSVSDLGWPTNPISQTLFAYCVNSFTTAAVLRWPCSMLYCFELPSVILFMKWGWWQLISYTTDVGNLRTLFSKQLPAGAVAMFYIRVGRTLLTHEKHD